MSDATSAIDALTEKEKEPLRLIVRGHDAKSAGRELDITVHAVNERLRSARRKLSVTSSREAARLLRKAERDTYKKDGDTDSGDATRSPQSDDAHAPGASQGAWWKGRHGVAMLWGVTVMIFAAAALVLSAPVTGGAQDPESYESVEVARDAAVEAAALRWLAMVDRSDWNGSFDMAAEEFRERDTREQWASYAARSRGVLGELVSREHLSSRFVDAGPDSFRQVIYRSEFAGGVVQLEALALQRDGAEWEVTTYLID